MCNAVGSGLYLKALSHGMDKILSGYRKALVDLEQKVILLLYHLFLTL